MPPELSSLWDLTAASLLPAERSVADAGGHVALAQMVGRSTLQTPLADLRGRCVLLASVRQLPFVLALLQLDGVARRILLCPPDLDPQHLAAIIAEAGVDCIVSDGTGAATAGAEIISCGEALVPAPPLRRDIATEWVLFTSGTTGRPKLVVHSLASLAGPLDDGLVVAPDAVWSTFYDVRRYGGLQILLRALLGGGSMVLSQAGEPVGDFLMRAGRCGVTHISGTPSHWRRALMSPKAQAMAPAYVRLSGEIADQAILDQLALAFPKASIAHAFASTEAGVAFDVRDGRAGFPASLIGPGAKTEMRVIDGSLRIRSSRTADRYLGDGKTLGDDEGFVDTGDMVALDGDRYHFTGRREGVINVGGAKVWPEEVEAVINRHPGVRMALVRGRRSPITGQLVVADIVRSAEAPPFAELRDSIMESCRQDLPPHKVPAMLREVASLEIAPSGKLVRPHA